MHKTFKLVLNRITRAFRRSKVDDVVAQFDATVTALKRIAAESSKLAAKRRVQIAKMEQKHTVAVSEADRAQAVAAKISALLN